MTVVDVNTGKFTGSGGNLEETVTKNNLEAAEEIVRQLRLRDIGGIIVVDFIDMVLESNRDLVLRRLVECLGRDRTRHQVAEVTSLGLVQMTRKRIGTGLLEAFSESCEHCGGRGVVLHDMPVEPKRARGRLAARRRREPWRPRRQGPRTAANAAGRDAVPQGRRRRWPAPKPPPSERRPAEAGAGRRRAEPVDEPTGDELEPSRAARGRSARGVEPRRRPPRSRAAEQAAAEDGAPDAPLRGAGPDEPRAAPEPSRRHAEPPAPAGRRPKVVTRTRRRSASRPAGPPATPPASRGRRPDAG